MAERLVVDEADAYELLAYLVASAETLTFEPRYYGPFRLIDAAGKLVAALLKTGYDPWLEAFMRDLNRFASPSARGQECDRFLREAPARLATELRRRIGHAASDTTTG